MYSSCAVRKSNPSVAREDTWLYPDFSTTKKNTEKKWRRSLGSPFPVWNKRRTKTTRKIWIKQVADDVNGVSVNYWLLYKIRRINMKSIFFSLDREVFGSATHPRNPINLIETRKNSKSLKSVCAVCPTSDPSNKTSVSLQQYFFYFLFVLFK